MNPISIKTLSPFLLGQSYVVVPKPHGFFLSFSTLGLCCVWFFPSYSAPKEPENKTHQTQISLFYKTHQCLEKLEKNIETQTKAKQSTWTKTLKYKHWNLEEYKTEQGGFTEGERERENVVTWAEFGADELTDFGAGERWACRWCWVFSGMGSSLNRCCHAWDNEMNWTTGVWYKGWVSEKVKEVNLCWFREVGEVSEWGSGLWVMASEGREQKLREKVSVNHIAKPGRSQKKASSNGLQVMWLLTAPAPRSWS